MDITINEQNDLTVIKFNKTSVLGNEGVEFQDSIMSTLDKGTKKILVELSLVEYITSWGIGMLVHAFTTATNRNAEFILTGVTKKVKEILSKVRLDTVFVIKES